LTAHNGATGNSAANPANPVTVMAPRAGIPRTLQTEVLTG
jgi:hypothetical protein